MTGQILVERATIEQALEALEQSETTVPYEGFGMAHREAERKHQAAITALRAALAQEQAEPAQEILTQPEPAQEPERVGFGVKSIKFGPVFCIAGGSGSGGNLPQPEPEPEPVAQAMQDAAVYGVGISRDGKRIDPASIYEQPAQEPVAGAVLNADGRLVLVANGMEDWYCKERNARRLYAAPQPQRQPLTDEEIDAITRDRWGTQLLGVMVQAHREYARAIERKVRGE